MAGAAHKVVELISEDDDPNSIPNDLEGAEVAQFSVIAGIQDDLVELVKKKLLDSIELQQFIVNLEFEFFEKYIDFLTEQQNRVHYNNHNELEEIQDSSLNPEQKEIELANAGNRLNGLRIKIATLGRREQKACNYLSSGINQIKVLASSSAPGADRYKISNKEWICSMNNSITLQKIKLICEKLLDVELKREVTFWVKEVISLIEKLDGNDREVALGMIVEMVSWSSGRSSNDNLLALASNLIEKKEAKEHICGRFDKWTIASYTSIDQYIWNTKVLAALMIRLSVTDKLYREKFAQNICQLMIKTLEDNELKMNHLMGMITIFESIGQHLGSVLQKYDQIFSLLNSKSHILESSEQFRISHLMRFRSIISPSLSDPIIAAAVHPHARGSVRNLTIIEHSTTEIGQTHSMTTEERIELERQLRMKIKEDLRIEAENEAIEKRKREEQEEKKRKEEERKKKEDEEKEKRKIEELEKEIRIKVENELRLKAKKEKEEEETKRKEMEAANRMKEKLERKKKEEMENEERKRDEEERRKAKEIEDAKKAEQLRIQKQIEEYKKNNSCTFVASGAQLFRHKNPGYYYGRDVLNGKLIGLLFSGQWCPACIEFVPYLTLFYSQLKDDFEVLFVSSDRSEQEMNSFLKSCHGDWYNLPFNSSEGNRLKSNLGITSIPTLLVLKPNGNYINVNQCSAVMSCENPRQLVNQWKNNINS